MAMPYFPVYHSATSADARSSAALPLKSKLTSRAISISTGKPKPVRKAKNLAKMPASCGWYEAEDRNLPSVSSF